ncbi:MAG: tRNA (guanosine(46)-N7)-methyltransferase TrmB [Flavobacteriales bacterium]
MGKKKKLERFEEMKGFSNVIEPLSKEVLNSDHFLKGKWSSDFFKNDKPIVLELGCGKGEYTIYFSQKHSEKNFIAVDIKGARMWNGAKTALQHNLKNAAFLRTRVDFITSFFDKDEIDEIWLPFPDPQLKRNRIRKRLTGPLFTERYKQFLKPGGKIHLKTDNDILYQYTLEQIQEHDLKLFVHIPDVHNHTFKESPELKEKVCKIKTYYEEKALEIGKSIKYLQFGVH